MSDAHDLVAWVEAAELPYADAPRRELTHEAVAAEPREIIALPEAIRAGLEAWRTEGSATPTFLFVLNRALERAPRYLQLRFGRRGLDGQLASHAAALDRLHADVARSAARMLLDADRRRYKHCAGPECSLVYDDQSKPGTRRWCAMELCGGRSKYDVFAARRRARGA